MMSVKTRTTPEDPGFQESQGSPEEIYLGRGAAADVWWVSGSKRVRKVLRIVLKQVTHERTWAIVFDFKPHEDAWQQFLEEYHDKMASWSRLNHRNVVRVFRPGDGWNLDIEFCENGSVRDYLKTHPEVDKISMVRDVLDGVNYLHTLPSPIIHGNLNAGKLFVSQDGTTKIGEFGLAALCHPIAALVPSVNLTGLSRWLSPELLDLDAEDTAKPTKASDVWALGCTLYEIISGNLPYHPYKHDVRVQQQILQGRLPGSRGDTPGISPLRFIWPLVEACWPLAPGDRPTLPMLVKQFEDCSGNIRGPKSVVRPPLPGVRPSTKSPDPLELGWAAANARQPPSKPTKLQAEQTPKLKGNRIFLHLFQTGQDR
ncbi:hypothetical protein FS749_000117 [Ceratobasidium sp. UAMH 11750]|nr:hypothetical protein FS749_000117 [Ceratobasidium sp. UAMH 11750]